MMLMHFWNYILTFQYIEYIGMNILFINKYITKKGRKKKLTKEDYQKERGEVTNDNHRENEYNLR